MISFSIVIPIYKTEEYLDSCVESVICQSYRDFEIILVDDGSPDNCGSMCDRWAEKECRIKVVHRKNGGLSAARNTGILQAVNEFVMFLDSDDWWKDNSVLEKVALCLETTKADVISFNYQKSYGGKLDTPYFPKDLADSDKVESFAQMMRNGRYVTGACNKAIRRTLITENDLYFREGITSEDIDWTLRLAICCQKFAFVNVCVFIYRQIATSISHSVSPEKVECLCSNVQECIKLTEAADPALMGNLKAFTAYQYGMLLHNVANLPGSQRSRHLMKVVREMKWLLTCSGNKKIRLLQICTRLTGISGTMFMLRMRQKLLDRNGKGV